MHGPLGLLGVVGFRVVSSGLGGIVGLCVVGGRGVVFIGTDGVGAGVVLQGAASTS